MANLAAVSVGNYTKLFYDNGSAWAEVTNIQSLPAPTDEATVVAVQQYGQLYQKQLVGSRTVSAIELILNWNPTDVTHVGLATLYDTSAETKFYLEYTDAAGSAQTFQPFSAFVGSASLGSEFDAVRSMTHSLVVADGMGAYTETQPVYS